MLRKTVTERQQPISHPPVCTTTGDKSRAKKIWTVEEDEHLRQLVEMHSTGNWTLIAESLYDRTGKQCRERWHNHLGDGIKKGEWTEQEDRIIITMQHAIGNQWAKITKVLPGRTDNAVKNRFHATERAKVRGKFDESLYAVPIDEKFIQELMDLNDGRVDLQDLYEAGALKPPLDQLHISRNTPPVQPGYPVQADAFVPYQQPASYKLATTDFVMENKQEEVQEEDFVDDMEMEDDEDMQLQEQDPIDGLLDLDIISFDENDMNFSFDIVDEKAPAKPVGCGPEMDACCFSYFDWGCSSNSNAVAQPNQQQATRNGYNMCGLESWSSRSQQPQQQSQHQYAPQSQVKQHNALQQHSQQQQLQQQQQQQQMYTGYSNMPQAPQQQIMQQPQFAQLPIAPSHYPQVGQQQYQDPIKQEPYYGQEATPGGSYS